MDLKNITSNLPLLQKKYMVDNSNYAICFVNHDWVGAAKTYDQAIKKNLKIINLADK